MFTPKQIQDILRQYGLKPNRALGQNFLADRAARDKILAAGGFEGQRVLEVGPGLGALTKGLCRQAAQVTAVELDQSLVQVLRDTLCPRYPNLTVVEQDFLKFDLTPFQGHSWRAVGNLPYYITTPIAQRLALGLPDSMTLMVQAEAAPRFFAQPGDRVYGPLAVFCGIYYQGGPLFQLSPQSYYPPPQVHSTVLRLTRQEGVSSLPRPDEFWRFLTAIFAMRRKTIANNLTKSGTDRSVLQGALEQLGISSSARGESLAPMQLLALYYAINL